jgi:hypothetical protein
MLPIPERDLPPLDCGHIPFGVLEQALASRWEVECPVRSGQAKVLEVDHVDVGQIALASGDSGSSTSGGMIKPRSSQL